MEAIQIDDDMKERLALFAAARADYFRTSAHTLKSGELAALERRYDDAARDLSTWVLMKSVNSKVSY